MSERITKFNPEKKVKKEEIISQYKSEILKKGYRVTEIDNTRPWGGFLKIDNDQANKFISEYFSGTELPASTKGATLSPKLLFVEPEKELSWQVHEGRSEFWRVVKGPVGVFLSEDDKQPEKPKIFTNGETINIPVGTRHRLAGLKNKSGIVAEIWIHADPEHPSDESDIRRIEDNYGRKSPDKETTQ